jgi:glucose-6-phosphate 1-epimerase
VLTAHNRHATARIALHGGQVLSFCPKGGADLLFLSDLAVFQPGKAIRGGVPVCWPWFGADPLGLGRPAHGLARTRAWHLRRSATLPGGETLVELGLTDSADTRALWPHAFDLTLEITVGATLSLVLTTRNTGNSPFQITQALHSYFAVGDIARTTVVGLDGCHYIDKAQGAGGAVQQQAGAVQIHAEVDRIYTDAPASLAVVDGALQRRIALQVQGSRTAVVWNPWAAIAAGMADLDDDGYQRFVCVETANAADEVITVPPGGEHRLAVEIAVTPH